MGAFSSLEKNMSNNAGKLLNQGQQAAADGFFSFLFSEQKELIISGPGGVGKTFTMGYLIDEIMPRYHDACKMMGLTPEFTGVEMTATTNKAAEVLSLTAGRPTSTIHSLLGLKVQSDWESGSTDLIKGTNWKVHEKKIIFVDECSMIDRQLLALLDEGTHKCKIVYVGDHCQLAPVTEPISPVYRRNLPFFELTEQMRNNGQPALMSVCHQLRNTVETGEFHPIHIVPGVIDHLNDDQMLAEINQHFMTQTRTSRVLAYTNRRVMQFNDHIRELRQLPPQITVGEQLVNNSACRLPAAMLTVEEEISILRIDDTPSVVKLEPGVEITVLYADIETGLGQVFTKVPVPADKEHFNDLLKYYRRMKKWRLFYKMKEEFPDFRPRDAATVHKAQGSTYDTVFIDLDNISTCTNPNQAARLLYVAFSRAKNRVVLHGNLAERFGGLCFINASHAHGPYNKQ